MFLAVCALTVSYTTLATFFGHCNHINSNFVKWFLYDIVHIHLMSIVIFVNGTRFLMTQEDGLRIFIFFRSVMPVRLSASSFLITAKFFDSNEIQQDLRFFPTSPNDDPYNSRSPAVENQSCITNLLFSAIIFPHAYYLLITGSIQLNLLAPVVCFFEYQIFDSGRFFANLFSSK